MTAHPFRDGAPWGVLIRSLGRSLATMDYVRGRGKRRTLKSVGTGCCHMGAVGRRKGLADCGAREALVGRRKGYRVQAGASSWKT